MNNLFASMLSKLAMIAVGLLLPRITMVNYGSEINGLLNSANQLVVYLTLFEAGVQTVAIKALYEPVYQKDRDSINRILAAVHAQYKRTGVMYLVGLLVMSCLYGVAIQSRTISFWTAFGLVFFSGFGKVILFFFQGKYRILLQTEGKSYIDVNIQTIISILTGLAKVVLLNLRVNVVTVTAVSFLISLLQAWYIIRHIRKYYDWIDLSVEPDYGALEEKNSALIHQIATLIFLNTDVVILTFFCDLKVVSVYSVYKLITTSLSSVLCAVYDSFNFSLGQLFQAERERFVRLLDMAEVYFTALVFAVYSTAYVMFLPFIALYTAGIEDVSYLDPRLPLLFVAIELMAVCRNPLLKTINYAGHFRKTQSRTLIEAGINLILSLTMVRALGICGVLLGTVAALGFRCVDILHYANVRVLGRSCFRSLSTHLINVCMFGAVVWINTVIGLEIHSYGQFILTGCLLLPLHLAIYLGVQTGFHRREFEVLCALLKKRD